MANDESINILNLDKEDNLTAQTLGNPFFTIGSTSGSKSRREVSDDLEECFRLVEEKVMKWESSRTKIWDSGDVAVSEYLQAINEASRLSENLINLHVENEKKDDELLHRVQILIRIAMVKLEEEFTHILARRNRPFEPECMSFRSSDVSTMYGISICSFDSSTYSGELTINLVHQFAIPDLKRIVNAMFTTHFDQEYCEAYISVRRDALAECLFMLEVDNLSIDVGVVALTAQNSSFAIKIKKWNQAMKNFTSVYLASEKLLCDRVFGEFVSVSSTCFAKIFEVPMLRLLKYGEAVIDTKVRDPKTVLFMKLDMYEVLLDLLPDIDNMFLEEAGSSVRFVFREVLRRFGDSVGGTFLEFEKAVESLISTKPFTGGGISLLSKNVMHYIACLARDHSDTLNMVLELVTSNLKSNLDVQSLLYPDDALRYNFLLSNIFYMFFGDYWIKQHVAEYRGYAMAYEKATWSPILNLLREEGMHPQRVSKGVLKERLKSFNPSFEKVYKSQTAWLIPPTQLHEELQISVSTKVIQAYRSFLRRLEEVLSATSTAKFIKYNPDGIETFISDLFGGSRKSLRSSART
ncbi:hypothetical protein MKX01_013340 [Papaver californicum]|nr:hypothetical protein MKX01_013340 [Papaver californicum]